MKTFSAVALLALPLGAFGIDSFFGFLACNAHFLAGLSITSPGTDDKWNSSGAHTITWKTVS